MNTRVARSSVDKPEPIHVYPYPIATYTLVAEDCVPRRDEQREIIIGEGEDILWLKYLGNGIFESRRKGENTYNRRNAFLEITGDAWDGTFGGSDVTKNYRGKRWVIAYGVSGSVRLKELRRDRAKLSYHAIEWVIKELIAEKPLYDY